MQVLAMNYQNNIVLFEMNTLQQLISLMQSLVTTEALVEEKLQRLHNGTAIEVAELIMECICALLRNPSICE